MLQKSKLYGECFESGIFQKKMSERKAKEEYIDRVIAALEKVAKEDVAKGGLTQQEADERVPKLRMQLQLIKQQITADDSMTLESIKTVLELSFNLAAQGLGHQALDPETGEYRVRA